MTKNCVDCKRNLCNISTPRFYYILSVFYLNYILTNDILFIFNSTTNSSVKNTDYLAVTS